MLILQKTNFETANSFKFNYTLQHSIHYCGLRQIEYCGLCKVSHKAFLFQYFETII